MDLESILADFLPWEDRRNKVKTVTAILLMAKNIRLTREPLSRNRAVGCRIRTRAAASFDDLDPLASQSGYR